MLGAQGASKVVAGQWFWKQLPPSLSFCILNEIYLAIVMIKVESRRMRSAGILIISQAVKNRIVCDVPFNVFC